MMEKIIDTPLIWNRQGVSVALDYRRSHYADAGYCIDAPEFFPAGSIESFNSVVYPCIIRTAFREVDQ